MVRQFLLKINIHLPLESANTLLSNYSREVKTSIYPKTCMWMFVAALFIITQKWKQPICPPTDEWINTLWYILTVECHSATNNELVIHAITWIAKASCWVRVDNLKTPYTVWFYIYNILKNKTSILKNNKDRTDIWLPGVTGEAKRDH